MFLFPLELLWQGLNGLMKIIYTNRLIEWFRYCSHHEAMLNQIEKVLFPMCMVCATIITPLGIINTRNTADADITRIVPFLKYIKHIFNSSLQTASVCHNCCRACNLLLKQVLYPYQHANPAP